MWYSEMMESWGKALFIVSTNHLLCKSVILFLSICTHQRKQCSTKRWPLLREMFIPSPLWSLFLRLDQTMLVGITYTHLKWDVFHIKIMLVNRWYWWLQLCSTQWYLFPHLPGSKFSILKGPPYNAWNPQSCILI